MESNTKKNIHTTETTSTVEKITVILMVALLVITLFNMFQTSKLKVIVSSSGSTSAGTGVTAFASAGGAADSIIPVGVPEIYGPELGVSYDDVSASNPQRADQAIAVLGSLDQSIPLTGSALERYINILYKMENGISCEYCCGARAIIFEDGQPACGCAHSFAMRGLAKYLISEHGNEYTDAQILEELGKWKTLFFPGQLTQKAQILKSQGIELNYINLASNKYRGIEKSAAAGGGSGSGMVGGC